MKGRKVARDVKLRGEKEKEEEEEKEEKYTEIIGEDVTKWQGKLATKTRQTR